MSDEIILTTGKGKNKRQWSLTPDEFAEFECRFEENELVEIPYDLSQVKLTLREAPERR